MKVLITYPPLNFPMYVYPAMYILAGLFENSNVDVDLLDLNVEFLKYILSASNLKKAKKKISFLYKSKQISEDHRNYIKTFLFKYKKITDVVIKEGNKYYDLLVSKDTPDALRRRINYAIKLAFAPYYPTIIKAKGIFLLEENSKYTFNYKDLLVRTTNKEDNPYLDFYQYIIRKHKVHKYDLVSITIPFDTNLYPALTFSKLVKEKTSCNVAIGGVLINATVNSYIKYPSLFANYFDSILTGEGEKSLIQYVQYLENKLPINLVSGAVYKRNNIICKNSIAFVDNVKQMKPPVFKNLDFNNYLFKKINLEFSKGCYWGKCVYCCSSIKRYHVINVIEAVNRIENIIKETGINVFAVLDDAVNLNFANKFATEIIKRKLNIEYHMYIRLEKELNDNLFETLYESGLRSIFFGLESASSRILNIMNKGIDINDVPRILKASHSAGIHNIVSFVLGFPFETEEDLIKTIRFQKENNEYIDVINNFGFTLLKGSGLLKEKEKFNITNIKDVEEFSNYLLYEAPGLSQSRINEILEENNLNTVSLFTRW